MPIGFYRDFAIFAVFYGVVDEIFYRHGEKLKIRFYKVVWRGAGDWAFFELVDEEHFFDIDDEVLEQKLAFVEIVAFGGELFDFGKLIYEAV